MVKLLQLAVLTRRAMAYDEASEAMAEPDIGGDGGVDAGEDGRGRRVVEVHLAIHLEGASAALEGVLRLHLGHEGPRLE